MPHAPALRLALLAAVLASGAIPPGLPRAEVAADHEAAAFARCSGPGRVTCVVDGDTFWYRGTKIRLADINAPETGTPRCEREARLGRRATARLTELLNSGPFSLEPNPDGRNRDRYGRLLRTVTRRGASVGAILTGEGLAETWRGRRGDWCGGVRAAAPLAVRPAGPRGTPG